MTYLFRILGLMTICMIGLSAFNAAYAACSNPAGVEGEMVYNSTHNTMQFCDDTNWIDMGVGAGGGGGAGEVCRQNGFANGNTGPTCSSGSPTWLECALISAQSVRGLDGTTHTCADSGYDDCMGDFFDLQTDCNDGVCDADFRIGRGVLICYDN